MTRRTGEPPHHNTLTCYTDYGCRLPACVERRRAWQRELRRKQREGQPALIDAEPVRRHLTALQAQGISINAIARSIGIDEWTLRGFLPSSSGKRPRKHRVTPQVADRILAVTADQIIVGYTDGAGTRRRIQALVANGWPIRRLGEHLDLHGTYVADLVSGRRKEGPVLTATAAKVAEAYGRLKDQKPTRHGIEARVVKRIRGIAAARQWAPTKYWDDRMDVIDDPDFTSLYGITRREIVAQDANEVMRLSGLDRAAAAERLGVSKAYIDHAFRDHPQYAIGVAA
ncbi:hypothetical protein [Streptomyces sp. NPDC093060]|uniref:hypothetical protein n=1 Tax=Streptomyces sp. NPDC093060 TaxID=3366019 RepID=UPI00381C25EF